jgi:NDP-sugar pyrophosphorylase family protein
VLDGDSLSDFDLAGLVALDARHDATATIALTEVPDARAYGAVRLDDTGRLTGFAEKSSRPGGG